LRNPGGYGVESGPDGKLVRELDSFTCFHCQKVSFVKPFEKPEDAGGLCKICMRLICKWCVGRAEQAAPGRGCIPFEKRLDQMEARERFLRSAGIMEVGS